METLGRNPKAELVAAAEIMEPADLAEVSEIAWRLIAWRKAKSEARDLFGVHSEQFKKSDYHLKRMRHRLRQARHNGSSMSDVDWLSSEKLDELINIFPNRVGAPSAEMC